MKFNTARQARTIEEQHGTVSRTKSKEKQDESNYLLKIVALDTT